MLRKLFDYQLSLTEKGKPLSKIKPFIEATDTFFYEAPINTTRGPHIRDAIDIKRWMMIVVFALLPCILMAIWNTGLQSFVYSSGDYTLMNEYLVGASSLNGYFAFAFKNDRYLQILKEGLALFLPIVIITYAVGGLCEGVFACVRGHEISEGFLVTGILYALILPPTIPYWMIAIGVAVGVILGKEIFGGSGMNVVNPALICRAFLFFTFPGRMSGDIWVGRSAAEVRSSLAKMNHNAHATSFDGYSQATPLTRFNVSPEIKKIHIDAIATNNMGKDVGAFPSIEKQFHTWSQSSEHQQAVLGKLSSEEMQQFVTAPVAEGGLGLSSGLYEEAYHFSSLNYGIGHDNDWSLFLGDKIGSFGETSVLACLLGAACLIYTGVGSWRTMAGMTLGAFLCAWLFQAGASFFGAEGGAKYKTNKEGDQFIGHFGLGFYSAYMVADKVEINTLSYRPSSEAVLWSCDGSSEYEIGPGTRQTRGTDVILFIGKEHEECLDEAHIRHTLNHYCGFLPYPIYLNGTHINHQEPLWIKAPSECTPKDYLDFYKHLYPMEEDPLFWVHLNVDYPFHLKGILYFPKVRRDFDLSKSSVKLYCNRVFVSDNCKDLIPNYLMVLRGIIDSPDIPLNVSRSYLQMDRTVRQLATHISKKVSDSLSTLFRNDKEQYIRCWEDVSTIVKLGILEDDKFYDRVKDILIWKNTNASWITISEYLERNREKTKDKILYTTDEKHASHFLDMYAKQGIEVLCANDHLDPYLFHFLEGKLSPVLFQRIDAGVDESILDKSREKTILDAQGKTEAGLLAEFIHSKLDDPTIEVEAKSLATESLPGFVMMEEKQRRMRDYLMRVEGNKGDVGHHALFGKRTFVVNTNNSLILSIQQLDKSQPELAKDLVREVYEIALLSQKEMDASTLHEFINRSNRILETLAKQAAARGV